MRRMAWMLTCVGLSAAAQGPTQATEEVDPTLFSAAPVESARKPWGLRLIAGPEWQHGQGLSGSTGWRGALDFRREFSWSEGWRAVLSNRLEVTHSASGQRASTHALREAYVSHAVNAQWFVDAGRINVRSGVGLGYNPTDWLRGNVLATPANQNPASARDNRLGAFVLRAQGVTDDGSMHWVYAPRLTASSREPMRAWGLNLARGNDAHGFQWRYAPRISETLSLDVLALARVGQPFEVGANLSAVLTPSLVGHAEVTVARRQHLNTDGKRLTPRAALGLSWTSPSGVVLGVEYQHADDGLSGKEWHRLRHDPEAMGALNLLRSDRARTQDPLMRSGWFARLQWNDVLRDGRYDIGAFVRLNPHDRSRLWQLNTAWHLSPSFSLRLIALGVQGGRHTEYGARPLRRYLWIGGEAFF